MMMAGIIWALAAGMMLGLYALPEKYTKNFEYEHTWGLFFLLSMFLLPVIAAVALLGGFSIFGMAGSAVLLKMAIASMLWGTGMMMWGKAINHIGLSLGFSLFIGTVILVGSLLPFFVDGLPPINVFVTILGGLFIVLVGVVLNGKAGLAREQDEQSDAEESNQRGSMLIGILIAVVGGLLATGFSFANAVGFGPLNAAALELGLAPWKSAIAVMCVIYFCGGLFMAPYFMQQLSKKRLWVGFRTAAFGRNIGLIFIMAVFNFVASAVFAFAASKLGDAGNTVGYAIFNATCVVTASGTGLIVGEWKKASSRSRAFLYAGLVCMVIGIVVIAAGNGLG